MQKLKQKAVNESGLGIVIEDREMAMLTPNETPTQQNNGQ
jgi:hypothetical protein